MPRRNSVPCNECVDISPLQQAERFISVSENPANYAATQCLLSSVTDEVGIPQIKGYFWTDPMNKAK
jgi:hypothetical protein